MSYAKIFATRAEYIAAKAEGGEIYSLLSGSNSVAVVSYITATGESTVDSINTIVPREAGQLGDLLLYQSATGLFCWAKGNSGSTTSIGSNVIEQTKLVNLGYVIVGWCVDKQSKECLIASAANIGTTYPWAADTTTKIPGVNTFLQIKRNDGFKTWIVSGSREVVESYFSEPNQYVLPILRSAWDAAGNDVEMTYTATEGAITINKSDYDNDYDKWYRLKVALQYPARGTCMQDKEGKKNTAALIAYQGEGSTYAPQKAYAHSVAAPGFAVGDWWLPSVGELWKILENNLLLRAKGMPITNSGYWSSTQFSATYAWRVGMGNGDVYADAKSYTKYVRAVSAFHI